MTATTEWTYENSTTTQGAPPCPPPGDPTTPGYAGLRSCDLPDIVFQDSADPTDRVRALAGAAREHGLTDVADALEDGELTVAEHRQAVQNALDCMTAQGMEVLQFAEYESLYGTEFTFIIGWGDLPEPEASLVSTNCEDRHRTDVEFAYRILTGERFTDRARAVLQECMADYGVTDDVGHTLDELREVSPSQEATLTCQARAENKPPPPTDLPRPPGG